MKSKMKLPILSFFRDPSQAKGWTNTEWERLFQLARSAKLMGTLAVFIQEKGLEEYVPEKGRWFLNSGNVKAERGRRQTLWEIESLRRALFRNRFVSGSGQEAEIPLVLLKGAAYQAADLPWGRGRISVDVDVLTPLETLPQVEAALTIAGWLPEKKSEYDEHFYRDWMHEIPPMVHMDRHTTLDVHHTILPRTGRLTVDASLLFDEIVPLRDNLWILSPRDMLLHSTVHLFQDGELDNCSRDLLDLASMFRYFSEKDPDFWEKLLARARQLNLTRPLFHSVTFCRLLLNVPFPETFLSEMKKFGGKGLSRFLMRRLVPLTIEPEISGEEKRTAALARFCLYVRSHFLRMPIHLLIPHLWTKYWQRRRERKENEQEF